MAVNDGYKIYTLLVQYSTKTGHPTGLTKKNSPGDADYIAPILDTTTCPTTTPTPETMTITVAIATGFTVNCKINFGALTLSRNTSGSWVVPKKTYDSVIFDMQVLGTPFYTVKIFYGGNKIKTIKSPLTGQLLLLGPFESITRLEVISDLGDYNVDYGNDYF